MSHVTEAWQNGVGEAQRRTRMENWNDVRPLVKSESSLRSAGAARKATCTRILHTKSA